MLSGVRIYTSDNIWRQILTDFGATVLGDATLTDLNFDDLDIKSPMTPLQLKSLVLAAADSGRVLAKIFGESVSLSRIQSELLVLLYKTGGMSAADLKVALGYSPDATTHVVDTAVYQLRRMYGHDFILNTNGVYKIGGL
jgi:hypothetical protein